MFKDNNRLQYLFDRYVTGQYTPEEWTEFWELVEEMKDADPMMDQMKVWWDKYEGEYDLSMDANPQAILNRVLTGEADAIPETPVRKHIFSAVWMRYAAAVLLLLSGFGGYLYFFNIKQPAARVITVAPLPPAPTDIAPGQDKAILTLSNGKQVVLDNTNKTVISDAGIEINKVGGELIYGQTDIAAFNTMTTPRGGQYRLTLPDGSKVWLNAASSITYPTVFTNERSVSITGEAYFEIAQDPKKPFKVRLHDQSEVLALGTQFNVNSYADEPVMTTTLLEGAVKIGASILSPGEAYSNGKVGKADTEAAIAWKNGVFIFNKADLRSVMRQLARWYDVEVKYEGKIRIRTFSGKIERDLSLSDLLDGLKRTDVHFRIEGKQLIVTS